MIVQHVDTINKKKETGIGLLELMLTLLIIGLILFTVTRYFALVNENLRIAQAEQQINTIVGASYRWLQGETDFSTITLKQLAEAGLIPQNYLDQHASPWKSNIELLPTNSNSSIIIVFNTLPLKSCNTLRDRLQKYSQLTVCLPNPSGQFRFTGTF